MTDASFSWEKQRYLVGIPVEVSSANYETRDLGKDTAQGLCSSFQAVGIPDKERKPQSTTTM